MTKLLGGFLRRLHHKHNTVTCVLEVVEQARQSIVNQLNQTPFTLVFCIVHV